VAVAARRCCPCRPPPPSPARGPRARQAERDGQWRPWQLGGVARVAHRRRRDAEEQLHFVFFFDDNFEFVTGAAVAEGIVNLRDVVTGEYVEFGEGKNGFMREAHAENTGTSARSTHTR